MRSILRRFTRSEDPGSEFSEFPDLDTAKQSHLRCLEETAKYMRITADDALACAHAVNRMKDDIAGQTVELAVAQSLKASAKVQSATVLAEAIASETAEFDDLEVLAAATIYTRALFERACEADQKAVDFYKVVRGPEPQDFQRQLDALGQ